jgi:ferric iron reductase protein FhuF
VQLRVTSALDGNDHVALAEAIAASVGRLGRFGASYPIYVERPDGHEIVPAVDLLSATNLRHFCERAIIEWTQHPEEEDMRAAASRFMRRYCGSVATAALLPLAYGVTWDVSLERIAFLIRTEMPMGVVIDLAASPVFSCSERPTTWPVAGQRLATLDELRARAIDSALVRNLAPAFESVLDFVQLNPKVLWSTAAEQIDLMYENAIEGLREAEFAPFEADRGLLLFGERLPGWAGANPLRGLLDWEDAHDPQFPRPLQVRRTCCVCYVIPGRNAYCRTCGLISAEQRLAMWRAWKAQLV